MSNFPSIYIIGEVCYCTVQKLMYIKLRGGSWALNGSFELHKLISARVIFKLDYFQFFSQTNHRVSGDLKDQKDNF